MCSTMDRVSSSSTTPRGRKNVPLTFFDDDGNDARSVSALYPGVCDAARAAVVGAKARAARSAPSATAFSTAQSAAPEKKYCSDGEINPV